MIKIGDPKKLKKKYETPAHPWIQSEIEANREVRKEYGLNRRKEILIAESFLKKYKNIAKKLIANQTAQGEKEGKQMMDKMQKLGLLQVGAELDDVLSLELKDILERRLQSLVFRKGFARSAKQARQFITHRHVKIGDKEITSPSYITSLEEESKIQFKGNSSLSDEEHPERKNPEKEVVAEIKKDKEEIKESAEKKEEETKAKEVEPKQEEPQQAPAEETPAESTQEQEDATPVLKEDEKAAETDDANETEEQSENPEEPNNETKEEVKE